MGSTALPAGSWETVSRKAFSGFFLSVSQAVGAAMFINAKANVREGMYEGFLSPLKRPSIKACL